MNTVAHLKNFSNILIDWYRCTCRDLPWRHTGDPYKIWISEVMLQQTTVKAVIPYYQKWIKAFPNVTTVSRASLDKILKSWQGLGYYQRAKNIQNAARLIVKDYAGKIPEDFKQLRELPGFGPYTTGAVLSIAFDKRFPIIDANVRRVVMRLLEIGGQATTEHDGKILKFLDRVMPHSEMKYFNQALMELGALVCRSREPLCGQCPVKGYCCAYKKGIQEIIPVAKNVEIKNIKAVIGVIESCGKYFIQKRPKTGLLANLWEFPGGKIEKKEAPREALLRELKEELGVTLTKSKPLMQVDHFYTQYRVKLHVFSCHVDPLPGSDRTHCWVNLSQIQKFPFPSGSAKIVDHLLKKSKQVKI